MADSPFPLPRTVLGRRFREDIGHPLAAYLKFLFGPSPRLDALSRHKFKILLGLLTPVIASVLRKLQQQRRFVRFLKEQAEAAKAAAPAVPEGFLNPKVDGAGFEKVKLPSTYEMLRSDEGNMGFKEFFGTIGLCVGASAVMVWKAIVLGLLLARQNDTGLSRAWAYYALQYPLLCIANVAFFDSTGYLKRRIQLKWRRNVTRKLHSIYFSKMRYYRILNEDKDLIITDPDIRICNDVKDLIGLTAEVLLSLTMAIFFTVSFGSATISNRNWRWSLTSPGFFAMAITSLRYADPPAIYAAYGAMQQHSSKITQLMTRTQLHAERICQLRGESFELHHLEQGLQGMAFSSQQICSLSFFRNALNTTLFQSPDSAAFIEGTAMVTCACMGANDIVSGAANMGALDNLPLNPHQPFPWGGNHMATMMRDMHGFFNACSGWGSFMQAYFGLRDFTHITARLKELFYKLEVLGTAEGGTATEVFSDEGPVISFDGVTIQTPTHNVLLKDLTFKVEQGSTLLICGHNGAGKSSIIRTLCSLWPVPEGKIARPGGHVQAEENTNLHDEVYYLPQKPCNVLGTLSDQLTYPLSIPGGVPKDELRKWLGYVGLEYLVDRKVSAGAISRVAGNESDHNDIDWEVLLSMGEQQALSIARLLYHHPRFAILDECTSAVGKELERRLFELAREIGISCVTITHRPALKEHHARLLQLTGEREKDGRGWEISKLHDESQLPPTKPRCKDADEVHGRIAAFLEKKNHSSRQGSSPTSLGDANAADLSQAHALEEERSAEYKKQVVSSTRVTANGAVLARWPSRLSRIWAVIKLGLPSAKERSKAWKRLLIMAVVLRLRVWVFWFYWRGMTGMLQASFIGDRPQVLAEYVCALGTAVISGALDQTFRMQAELTSLDLWQTTMEHLPRRVLSNANFLKMMNPPENSKIPEVESPALRLSEVKGAFDAMLGQVSDVVLPLCQGIAFLPSMVTGLGGLSPVLLVVNFMLFRGSQLIAPNFPEIQKRTNTLESRFQVLHTRLRSIAEPVAFSGGGEAERRIVEPHFDDVLEHYEQSARQETLYNMMVTAFTDYRQMPVWTQRLASMRYAMFNNPMHPEGVSGSTIVSNFLFDRTIQFPQVAVQKIVKLTEASGRIDGQCARILELVAACDAIDQEPKPLWEAPPEGSTSIKVSGLDLVTRREVCLAKGLDFSVEAGVPMVVTGPNATGKSLLGSVLLGLWHGEGPKALVSIPGATSLRPPLTTIMPAPQQIYLPGGCLYDQLSYPVPVCSCAGPPSELLVKDADEDVKQANLAGMLTPFGCVDITTLPRGGGKKDLKLRFVSKEGAIWVAARPHFLKVNGKELNFYFVDKEPNSEGRELPDLVRMRKAIQAVGIDHILTREDAGWMTSKVWSDALSGGEQQRLCVARVLYHQPTFALLDECTSMVAVDAEQALYRMLFKEWNITPLTLTQRLFMEDFYKRELRLGIRSKAGWECVDMEETKNPVAG